ncbi:MAG TPA: valine--tRNA ligase [Dehalococcoidia bacterium]|nr:valine--tRNA ligase [Dehalococcoidia bacterium]
MTTVQELPKAYEPSQHEAAIYRLWEEGGYFQPRGDPQKPPFCIVMPPPNVTGALHMGHALTDTLEDVLVRWHRMKGEPTLWLPGVDHAGIATQNVVERELAKEGLSRHDLGREAFLQRVWEWAQRTRATITQQHRRLGASCDWTRERFTLDEGPSRAVRTTFVRLYHDGLVYRGERIINWCPRCRTALSDLEVEHQEHDGRLWFVRYPLLDDQGRPTDQFIVVATTRPETIVADVAVAVNPQVERWRPLIGRRCLVPVVGRPVPIIADEAVDPRFGTGALKITPGHDALDFEIGERHRLPAIVSIGPDGRMNEQAGPLAGLDRFEARKEMARRLQELGLLEREEAHRHSIGHCQRCGTIVEPIVSEQWFVRMRPLALPAVRAVREGRVRIVPRRFVRIYLHWLENIRDWCISRQLWWGHRIPAWYCGACGAVTVPPRDDPMRDPQRCGACGSPDLRQDEDVLDTWFSSALWPHSTLGWPDDTEDLRRFYPTSVLETGYDILFFWVARMVMMGLYNTGQVPFRYVYLHGLVRDPHGRKMTKSLGNVVDPLEAVDRYGCDALRYVLATGAAPGNDMRLSAEKLEGGRNFANKVWNAGRFVVQALAEHLAPGEKVEAPSGRRRRSLPLEDRWILSRLHQTIGRVERLLRQFQIGEAGKRLHEFFWGELCDWYLEMAKVRLRQGDRDALAVLAYALDMSLRLLHPFMPFVTEALWQRLRPHLAWAETEALIAAPWPRARRSWLDSEAERQMGLVMGVVRAMRNLRAEWRVEPGRWVEAFVASPEAGVLAGLAPAVEALARARPLHISPDPASLPAQGAATAVLPGAQVALPLAGLVEVERERERLQRQLQEAEREVEGLARRLAQAEFRARAPAQVVAREEERLAAARQRLEGLRRRLQALG